MAIGKNILRKKWFKKLSIEKHSSDRNLKIWYSPILPRCIFFFHYEIMHWKYYT